MFKIGDEVLCVDVTLNYTLTKGDVYKVIGRYGSNCIAVIHPRTFYNIKRFIPNTPEAKAEYMRKKLEEE